MTAFGTSGRNTSCFMFWQQQLWQQAASSWVLIILATFSRVRWSPY
jgi:hypothetical protein